ncbi:MAG: 5-formyltetrahydrofolate cyclo-ligase [Alphaproteobacteria bacterium]|nr:5-formyltetrahydrofolate cyclo-ligase [Alphaproteobacteria bacterium]
MTAGATGQTLAERKAAARAAASAARQSAHGERGAVAGEALRDVVLSRFAGALELPPARVVAGYWPIRDEIDVRPLMAALAGIGHALALPVVVTRGEALLFRSWAPDMPLIAGAFGLREPPPGSPAVRPEILLVPLLAFDASGGRLGYGAGYYDRTLASLRATGPVAAIGVGYEAQALDPVPTGPGDARLDWIATERRVIRAGRTEDEGRDADTLLR